MFCLRFFSYAKLLILLDNCTLLFHNKRTIESFRFLAYLRSGQKLGETYQLSNSNYDTYCIKDFQEIKRGKYKTFTIKKGPQEIVDGLQNIVHAFSIPNGYSVISLSHYNS